MLSKYILIMVLNTMNAASEDDIKLFAMHNEQKSNCLSQLDLQNTAKEEENHTANSESLPEKNSPLKRTCCQKFGFFIVESIFNPIRTFFFGPLHEERIVLTYSYQIETDEDTDENIDEEDLMFENSQLVFKNPCKISD